MQITHSHPTYGLITYDESFWTGKKTILFDGIPLVKKNKTTFEVPATETTPALTVIVSGNYISGLKLTIGEEVVTLSEKPRWYDYVLGILPGVMLYLFIIQGAIGGGLAGMLGVCGTFLMKSRPNIGQKLLISLGSSAVIVAVGIALTIMILSQA